MASAAVSVHTVGNTPTKSESSQPKSNQHQLAPINQSPDNPNTGETEYNVKGYFVGVCVRLLRRMYLSMYWESFTHLQLMRGWNR